MGVNPNGDDNSNKETNFQSLSNARSGDNGTFIENGSNRGQPSQGLERNYLETNIGESQERGQNGCIQLGPGLAKPPMSISNMTLHSPGLRSDLLPWGCDLTHLTDENRRKVLD